MDHAILKAIGIAAAKIHILEVHGQNAGFGQDINNEIKVAGQRQKDPFARCQNSRRLGGSRNKHDTQLRCQTKAELRTSSAMVNFAFGGAMRIDSSQGGDCSTSAARLSGSTVPPELRRGSSEERRLHRYGASVF